MTQRKKHEERYKDGDLLSASQAASVVSENSGHVVASRYMSKLCDLGILKNVPKVGRYRVYPYSLIKNFIVQYESSGRPQLPDNQVKARSLYMREYKRRRREDRCKAQKRESPE